MCPNHVVATGGNGQAAKSSDEIGRLAALAALGCLDVDGSTQAWDEPDESPLLARERFAPRVRAS